jgi:hypothetical protein
MTDKSPHTVRVNDETWAAFVEWIEDVEGQKHGEIGRHVETALNEYMNEDRQARVEQNQHEMLEQLEALRTRLDEQESTHTHTAETGCTDTDQVAAIHERIVNKDKGAVKDDLVEEAIVTVAELPVGDDRTIRKYKQRLQKRGLLFEHPGEPPLWTADRDLWANWATREATSRNDLETTVEPYPAQVYENGSGLQIEIEEVEI